MLPTLKPRMVNTSRVMTSYYMAKFCFIGGDGELVDLSDVEVFDVVCFCRKQKFRVKATDITYDYEKNRVCIFLDASRLRGGKAGSMWLSFKYRSKGLDSFKHFKVELKYLPNEYMNKWERKRKAHNKR